MSWPEPDVGLLLLALAVLACLPWARRPLRASRALPVRASRRHRSARELVDGAVVLDLVRAALASGVDVVGAIEAVGAALPGDQGTPYLRAAKALRLGAAWEVAWPVPSAAADALAPAWTDGVDPEPLLVHAAAAIRRTRQARAREAAARLGVRLVLPLGLCLLPAFVLLGLVPVLLAAGLELWGA
ncbi:secretion system protein [Pseudactinotalea suaedae]|uniref:secretion system protein n=1 Tax=Pseudactinotalea suaedae TaxID=1524924 RepID=UPI001F4FF645|nr:secretion system protein [Pseudactinotalea suaedae]